MFAVKAEGYKQMKIELFTFLNLMFNNIVSKE